MTAWLAVPEPPDFRISWSEVERSFPLREDMARCAQEAEHHAEGDVWTHTRLACEALVANDAWRALPSVEREDVYLAALLHDVGKPDTTRVEAGRITSRGHARRGALLARRLLWRAGFPFTRREAICALVRRHLVPFFILEKPQPSRFVHEVSQTARCDHLALLATGDACGRICRDLPRLLESVALFTELCREEACLAAPRFFPSDHSRFLYFRSERRDPGYLAHDDTRCEVVVMSGLPGSGKDHWVRTHLPGWPAVSPDDVRTELGVPPEKAQGPVVSRSREIARQHLRAGRSFAWNATHLSRAMRAGTIGLAASYGARIRIVYVEVPEHRLREQNRARTKPVPERVIERLLDRWEVPDLTEAHAVDLVLPV